ncbi:MAG: aspartate aminotransferase family protein, partial [Rhodospirillaceae bacterium]
MTAVANSAAVPPVSPAANTPDSRIFHRSCKAVPKTALRGKGMYLYDADGKAYLDGSGGAAVSCLGHGDAKLRRAIRRQTDALAFAHTGFFTSEPAEELASVLIDQAEATIPGNRLSKVYFVSGGSEANEAALKLARQYFLELGQPERSKIIARKQSYHGNTLGALAAGGNMWRREPYEPMLMPVSLIPACYPYREKEPDETDEAYGLRIANALETEILAAGPETVAAFIAEPVVGATSGALTPVPGYYKRIREICDRYGVLLILDEVMCGMGRTGTLYSCAQDGISPDILTCAKGLGAGYQPVGAMLVSSGIYDAIAQGSGAFMHGHTYMGHPVACAAGLAVQERFHQDGLLAKVPERGARLRKALEKRFGSHPHVGDIRGRGLFLGLELVADRDSKQCFDPKHKLHLKVKKAAYALGLICYPAGGTIDGRQGDHILLAPPFIIGPRDSAKLVDLLGQALDQALVEIGAA